MICSVMYSVGASFPVYLIQFDVCKYCIFNTLCCWFYLIQWCNRHVCFLNPVNSDRFVVAS